MPSLLQNLREINRRLMFRLDSITPHSGQPANTTSEHMAALLSELLQAGVRLRAEPLPAKGDNPELERELEKYRSYVEQFRELLPCIHSQLLAERARLEAQRSRVQAAAEWARASRQTV